MLTYTSLTHPTIIKKIDMAMRRATVESGTMPDHLGVANVSNKHGDSVLTVFHFRTKPGIAPFLFVNPKTEDITETVLQALRSH